MSMSATGRVSDLMKSEQLLAALTGTQSAINRSQLQITSGHLLNQASDDPVAAAQIMSLSTVLGRLGQFTKNTTYADGLLSSADTALSNATDLVRQAQSLAANSAGTTVSDSERSANAQLLSSIIAQLEQLANQKYQGRYLFDGQAGGGDPFTEQGGGVAYGGGTDPLQLSLSAGPALSVAMDGATVFGTGQPVIGGWTDLDPLASLSMRTTDLLGATGSGVALGRIQVSDGSSPAVTIDLSTAATLGDVIDQFNAAAPPGMAMSLDGSGKKLSIAAGAGADITVQDVGGGTAARDLGIAVAGGGPTVVGLDFQAKLTPTTAVAALRGGAGLDLASGLHVINGSLNATISFATATTVQDLINAINHAGVGLTASVAANGQSLQVVNTISGAGLRIAENGGQTATQLGLRTFNDSTLLSSLNDGQGVGMADPGGELHFTQRSGNAFDVELSWCPTVGAAVAAINAAPGNAGVVASIAPGGGIQLVDNSADAGGDFAVSPLNLSTAAADLGLQQSTRTNTIIGTDSSWVRGDGVFSHLLQLRDALAGNDQARISQLGGQVADDLNRLVEVRGAIGAKAAQVQQQSNTNGDDTLNGQTLLSGIQDVDLTEALTRFQQLQTQLTASMITAGKLLNVSLLDFLK